MNVVGFSPEELNLLKDFLLFPDKLYNEDKYYLKTFPQDLYKQFSPNVNPFFQYGQVKCFLLYENGLIIGRIAAFRNPKLDMSNLIHGCIGFFECEDNYSAAEALFSEAILWLQSFGCNYIYGPMNFSFWGGYRLKISGFEHPPYLNSPYNKQYYPEMFAKFGMSEFKKWYSRKVDYMQNTPLLAEKKKKNKRRFEKCESLGYKIKCVNKENIDTIINDIFQLSMLSFKNHFAFYEISKEEFIFWFGKMRDIIKPWQIILGEKDHVTHGYYTQYFNHFTAIQKMQGKFDLVSLFKYFIYKDNKTLIVPFAAISQEAMNDNSGLLSAMQHMVELGYTKHNIRYAIHSLMEENNRSNSVGAGISELIGTYALFSIIV